MSILYKLFKKKDPMDFLVDYVNDNLEDLYMTKIENEKDREPRKKRNQEKYDHRTSQHQTWRNNINDVQK